MSKIFRGKFFCDSGPRKRHSSAARKPRHAVALLSFLVAVNAPLSAHAALEMNFPAGLFAQLGAFNQSNASNGKACTPASTAPKDAESDFTTAAMIMQMLADRGTKAQQVRNNVVEGQEQ